VLFISIDKYAVPSGKWNGIPDNAEWIGTTVETPIPVSMLFPAE
jgi:hypothetical protein